MRHFSKSAQIPGTLLTAPTPTKASEVSPDYYKAADVKEQLQKDQFYKCAYCEKKIEGPYNDVEHYRPKSKYYWLGHAWSNLLFACNICNRTCKKDEFPLSDESSRHLDEKSIAGEDPLIINPAEEDPADYIVFNRAMAQPRVVDGEESIKGRYNIGLFRLNDRKGLVAERKAAYELFEGNLEVLRMTRTILGEANVEGPVREKIHDLLKCLEDSISAQVSPDAQYSGMLINNLAHPQSINL